MAEVNLRIENMHCGGCVKRVTQTLRAIPGAAVEEVRVGAARVQLAGGASPESLAAALARAGYPAHVEQ